MVLGMLVQLSKQETVSAMDTVEKSYSCYSRVQEFRSLEVQKFLSRQASNEYLLAQMGRGLGVIT